MSEEIVFRAGKGKAVLLLLGSIAFVAIGFWMTAEKPLLGWVCVGFFALGIPVAIMMMTSKSIYLRLDAQGFEMASPLKRTRLKWTEVDGFAMNDIHGAKVIQILYSPSYTREQLGRAVAVGLARMAGTNEIEGAIGNHYDAPLDEILRALNEWRARFA